MTMSPFQKSTIVRAHNAALPWFFRAAEWVAPGTGGRVARDLWFTAPPRLAATPLPPGGEAFTVRARGVRVRGHVWGAGPVVYLMHGWGGRGSQLAAYVEPLVAAGHRVVLFDAPSHGDSDPGLSGSGRTHGLEFALALHAAAAEYGPAHAVIAHSLGTVATYLAMQRGLSTERLALLAPMVEAEPLFHAFQQALGFGPRTRREFDREVDQFVGIPVPEFDARVQAARTEPVQTLVVHDTSDPQTPYDDAVALVGALPDARLVTTTGLGHRRILRDPAVVARVVDFLAPTPDRARSASTASDAA
jgi:pimeloyl-ACP methyl ester carboxylesterase